MLKNQVASHFRQLADTEGHSEGHFHVGINILINNKKLKAPHLSERLSAFYLYLLSNLAAK